MSSASLHRTLIDSSRIRRAWGATPRRFKGCCIQQEAEPHRERITRWWRQGIQGTTIYGAFVRSHGFTDSYSSVRRFLAGVEVAHPQVTTVPLKAEIDD